MSTIKQLEIDRDDFVNLLKEYDLINPILDQLDVPLSETESFIFSNMNGGDVSIIDKYSLDRTPKIINWYKQAHVGRCLNLYGFSNEDDFRNTLLEIKDELMK